MSARRTSFASLVSTLTLLGLGSTLLVGAAELRLGRWQRAVRERKTAIEVGMDVLAVLLRCDTLLQAVVQNLAHLGLHAV